MQMLLVPMCFFPQCPMWMFPLLPTRMMSQNRFKAEGMQWRKTLSSIPQVRWWLRHSIELNVEIKIRQALRTAECRAIGKREAVVAPVVVIVELPPFSRWRNGILLSFLCPSPLCASWVAVFFAAYPYVDILRFVKRKEEKISCLDGLFQSVCEKKFGGLDWRRSLTSSKLHHSLATKPVPSSDACPISSIAVFQHPIFMLLSSADWHVITPVTRKDHGQWWLKCPGCPSGDWYYVAKIELIDEPRDSHSTSEES